MPSTLFRAFFFWSWAGLAIHAADPAESPSTDPAVISKELGRGINLGNALEAPREGAWGVTLNENYFTLVEQAGFSTVRVPIRWSAHALNEAPYTIDPAFLARVDWAVAQAEAHHLRAILNMHNYDDLLKDPAVHEPRFLALWKQIAEHFQAEPASILFEIYNEPHDKLDASGWNELIVKTLAVIRPSNPTRLVIVGPLQWNGIPALPGLVLPESDPYLVATVHFYDPMKFTHQGAEWIPNSTPWLGTTWPGTAEERAAIGHSMDLAATWGRVHHRAMFLGEFGAYSKGDMDSRVRWTQCVARAAEARGMGWAYWEFCSSFGAYDPVKQEWRMPLLQALIPPAAP
jgi:endoglucanase